MRLVSRNQQVFFVETYGTEKTSIANILHAIKNEFDLRPKGIIDTLDLQRPIYSSTAAYGHFGRKEYPWEALDRVDAIKKYL
jgi:S-adenosylmethionine synthetase